MLEVDCRSFFLLWQSRPPDIAKPPACVASWKHADAASRSRNFVVVAKPAAQCCKNDHVTLQGRSHNNARPTGAPERATLQGRSHNDTRPTGALGRVTLQGQSHDATRPTGALGCLTLQERPCDIASRKHSDVASDPFLFLPLQSRAVVLQCYKPNVRRCKASRHYSNVRRPCCKVKSPDATKSKLFFDGRRPQLMAKRRRIKLVLLCSYMICIALIFYAEAN